MAIKSEFRMDQYTVVVTTTIGKTHPTLEFDRIRTNQMFLGLLEVEGWIKTTKNSGKYSEGILSGKIMDI